MNERIKELEKQCWSHYINETLIDGHLHFDTAKFAELIVQECVDILEEEIKLVEGFKSTAVKADVIKCHQSKIYHFHKLIDKSKKHFGVEE
jgi:hypothetical protein